MYVAECKHQAMHLRVKVVEQLAEEPRMQVDARAYLYRGFVSIYRLRGLASINRRIEVYLVYIAHQHGP